MRSLAIVSALMLALLGGCGDGGSEASDDDSVPSSSASSEPVTDEPATADPTSEPDEPLSGEPKTDPCDLLTQGMAEGALGVPVGEATKTPDEGYVTCMYVPADGQPNVFVLLTTYAASGEAALAEATSEFPDAKPVPDLGDAALVSRKGHAIGVAVGDVLFAMSMLREDGLSIDPAVAEAQLITLAHVVVESM